MKLRKPRPTHKDAEEFLRKGSYSVGQKDFINPEERWTQLHKLERTFYALWRAELARTHRLDVLLLKAHIVVEVFLTRFLSLAARNEIDFERERFTFAQKLTLAHAFGLPPDPVLLPTLDLLNTLRNQIAHRLTYDRRLIDQMITYNSELTQEEIGNLTDRQRSACIRQIVAFICGEFLGVLKMLHTVEFPEQVSESYRKQTSKRSGAPCS